jgi:hypothetical protein
MYTPIAFVLGALCGGALVWIWRRKRGADGGLSSGQKYKLVAATALTTVLLVAAVGYGVIRWRFRSAPATGASESQALKEFRRANPSGAGAARRGMPTAGVYAYKASGFYAMDAPLLGKERRDMPASIPAVLVHKDRCWNLTIRYFKQHHWTAQYCRTPAGRLERPWLEDKNEMFNMTTINHNRCTPLAILGPTGKIGAQWKQECKHVGPKPKLTLGKRDTTVTYVGLVPLTIGGQQVMAHHVNRHIKVTGIMGSGDLRRDVWFEKDTGMLLQLKQGGSLSGLGKMTAEYRLVLADLSPKK